MGKTPDEWSYGDLDAGFKNAALVLDETFVTPDTSHQMPRNAHRHGYWQNGKVYVHTGTQSTAQTVPAIARWLNIDPGQGRVHQRIHRRRIRQQSHRRRHADHSRAAVEEGQRAGDDAHQPRGRDITSAARGPACMGRMKVGFSKEGRIIALDMFVISDNGPYDAQGDAAYVRPHRFAAVSAAGHALARRDGADQHAAAQRAEFAGRHAGHHASWSRSSPRPRASSGSTRWRSGASIAPEGKAQFGPAGRMATRLHATSAFHQGGARPRRGAVQMAGTEWRAAPKRIGTKVRGVGVSLSCFVGGTIGFDGLSRYQAGRHGSRFQSGIGNLGTESVIDVHRVGAEVLGVPWEKCDVVWGNTAKNLPWTCVSGGSQTTHAMTRAAYAVGDGAQEETAGDRREESRRQARGLRGRERARLPQGRRRAA